ncbi:MAG: CDP-diacylglycerol--glycerol-3-phosphate 3-phosphatidyltransferase [Candidatus Omnitrophica bacterium]|nr:CDP-diacylglycerol--glycerol-3-phosphate 3-phosphatidyltransferase [Candidatus Omnitrophota bacterium]
MSPIKITPNHLTIIRVILAFVTFYLLIQSSFTARIVALFVFTVAALTDLWDGQLARSGAMVTNFGKILDPIADKILILGTLFILSDLGMYPFWALIPIFVREVGVTGIRFYFLGKNIVVAAERSGKIKVISQIISLFVTYVCLMVRDYSHSNIFFDLANYTFLAGATWFSLSSGWDFLKHNWRNLYA